MFTDAFYVSDACATIDAFRCQAPFVSVERLQPINTLCNVRLKTLFHVKAKQDAWKNLPERRRPSLSALVLLSIGTQTLPVHILWKSINNVAWSKIKKRKV